MFVSSYRAAVYKQCKLLNCRTGQWFGFVIYILEDLNSAQNICDSDPIMALDGILR